MLSVHRAERCDVLADALADVLRTPLADPFATEVVGVPAKGIERWLTQRLADRLGVAANIAFSSPTRLVDEAIAGGAGFSADDDPWGPQRVVWTLLALIDRCRDEPWCAVLATHLGSRQGQGVDEHRAGRRYATAAHLRELFRSYEAYRPAMLVDWAAGRDTDGTGEALAADLRWQAELWRRLRLELGTPSPAERLEQTCQALRADPDCSALPLRLSIFGATRLSTAQRAVLRALAEHREVLLWLPHPSPALWSTLSQATPSPRRRQDRTALAIQNRLTASLSRDIRELQLLLGEVETVHHPGPRPAGSVLAQVQAAIRDDRPPGPVVALDDTVQVHACHGPARQVEVLREALLHLFQNDATLQPRDVLVMCPDVETYAPLIRAAFGQPGSGHAGHQLRVRLADRALTQTNPLLDTVSGLLGLAADRVTASQLLDLAASAPVRRRFGFSDDELDRLALWSVRAGVRWGIGPQQRAAYGLGAVPQGTWATGLDRILLGVAADESELGWLGLALPLDDVDSSDIDLAGRLAELVDRLDHVLNRLQGSQPLHAWMAALTDALDLLADVSEADAWQLGQARSELAESAEHGQDAVLQLADLQVLLAARLAGRPTRANFGTGELTVCTMVPMRSVPHRVIALIGLDDGVFPRSGGVDGDDILQLDPCLGERDVRSEDRQLLLDAVLAAQDHLLLLYTGADPVSGASRSPAVPLGELLEVLVATVGSTELVTRHPLQPFDPRNFTGDQPFSFDRAALAGAQAAARPRLPLPSFLATPLPHQPGDVALVDLIGLLVHPTKGFLAQRLGLRVPEAQQARDDALRGDLEGLQKWDVGDRMLTARLAGTEPGEFWQAELRRGTLPPGPLGLRLLNEFEQAIEQLAQSVLSLRTGPARTVELSQQLGGDRLLSGTVTGLFGDTLLTTSYSALGPKHRLPAWITLLAVGAARAVTTGRGPYGRPVWRSTLTLPANPLAVLRDLVEVYEAGRCEPLPIATGASHTYADRRRGGSTVTEAQDAARQVWQDRFGDGTDRHLRYLLGDPPLFDQMLAAPDDGPEGTRFGALACRLWTPLLDAETVGAP